MTAFAAHFSYEFKAGLRNASAMLMNYLFPLGFYAMMGLVMTQINPLFRQSMIPALVLVTAMASFVLGLPAPLVESRARGIYRSYMINGVPAASLLAIPTLSTLFHTAIAAALIALSAGPLFGADTPARWDWFALVCLLTFANLAALGALIGVVSASARAVVLWSQLIFLPSMLVGGVMLPLSLLPPAIQRYAALLPSTHAMQAFEGLAFARPTPFDPSLSMLVLGAGAVLAFGLAIYLFNWDADARSRRGHPLLALLALAPYVAALFLV